MAGIPPLPPGFTLDQHPDLGRPVIRGAPPKPDKPDKPQFINRVVGDKTVTSRVNPDGSLTDLSSGPRWQQPQSTLTPEGKNKIRQDAATKINQIRKLRAHIESMSMPNVTGAGLGDWLKYIPGTPARGVAGSLSQIGAAGALTTALEMAKNNGGKNPLTPMSNSDINMVSNINAALDQGQSYGDLKKQLDNAEAAFGHAYVGAGGNPKSLSDRNRHDGPFPGKQRPKQQSRVINFSDLPE